MDDMLKIGDWCSWGETSNKTISTREEPPMHSSASSKQTVTIQHVIDMHNVPSRVNPPGRTNLVWIRSLGQLVQQMKQRRERSSVLQVSGRTLRTKECVLVTKKNTRSTLRKSPKCSREMRFFQSGLPFFRPESPSKSLLSFKGAHTRG